MSTRINPRVTPRVESSINQLRWILVINVSFPSFFLNRRCHSSTRVERQMSVPTWKSTRRRLLWLDCTRTESAAEEWFSLRSRPSPIFRIFKAGLNRKQNGVLFCWYISQEENTVTTVRQVHCLLLVREKKKRTLERSDMKTKISRWNTYRHDHTHTHTHVNEKVNVDFISSIE